MPPSALATLLQQLINGLTIGAVYALIALGYTLVYGIIQLINFAHGEVFMIGAYAGLTVLLAAGIAQPAGAPALTTWLAAMLAAGMVACGLLGLGIERAAYRPLRRAPKLAALITAIGLSFFLQNAVMLCYGAQDRYFPPLLPLVRWTMGGVTMTLMQAIILGAAAAMMWGLHRFITGTRLGTAMRAVSQDSTAAALVGIWVDRIIALAFLIGSALAAVGGILFGLYYNTINFHDGYMTGLKAFTAAVLGGIGNVPGAMVGGLLLGLLEGLSAGYLSAQWKNVCAFVVLVAILLLRPQGLLGERVAERT